MLLNEETAERILYLVRLCHPNEKDEPYTRGDMIEETDFAYFGYVVLGWLC